MPPFPPPFFRHPSCYWTSPLMISFFPSHHLCSIIPLPWAISSSFPINDLCCFLKSHNILFTENLRCAKTYGIHRNWQLLDIIWIEKLYLVILIKYFHIDSGPTEHLCLWLVALASHTQPTSWPCFDSVALAKYFDKNQLLMRGLIYSQS